MNPLDASSLPGMVARAVAERSAAAGFLVPREDRFRPISYQRFWNAVERVASALRASGVRPSDRVLLMMETRYEWMISDLAILSCGAWTVPVYPNLPASQLAIPLADSTPRAAIVTRPEQLARLLRASTGIPHEIETAFLLEGEAPAGPAIPATVLSLAPRIGMEETIEPAERETFEAIRSSIRGSDPATILYTSGTSATPKGVVLTHENLLSNVRMIHRTLRFLPSDRYLSLLPLAHILERTVSYALIAGGTPIGYARGIDTVARDAAQVRPTLLLGVPRFYERIRAAARANARQRGPLASRLYGAAESAAIRRGRAGPSLAIHGDGSSPTIPPRGLDRFFDRLVWKPIRDRFGGRLRYVVSGSAPLSTADALWFCGIGLPMLEGYGLTEAGPVVSVNTFGAWRVGSVGRPLPGLEVRIAEDGEILVRSPSVMPSYHNLPAESEGALRDGWLHTGDLGRLDDDSFLWITGRKKDLIVTSGGKNIAPQTIEDRLRRSPLIAEAAVFGDRRPYLVALILPDWEALATQLGPRALDHARAVSSPLHPDPELRALLRREIDRCSADLAAHERIRAFALMREPPSLESGTMTPTLKIRRPELEAEYAEALAALYEQRRV